MVGAPAAAWLAATLATLGARPNVTILPRTTAFGYYNHNHVALVERISDHLAAPREGLARERVWQVRAGEVVIAAGAYGAVQSSTYNTRALVPEVLVQGDQYAVVRPRVEVEELIAMDRLAPWL